MFSTNSSKICCSFAKIKIFEKSKMAAKIADMLCSSSNLYFARVIPSIQTVLLSIGALEFKNLQYTFKNLLQPIYKMQGTFTNI